jgi:hypothetical protein
MAEHLGDLPAVSLDKSAERAEAEVQEGRTQGPEPMEGEDLFVEQEAAEEEEGEDLNALLPIEEDPFEDPVTGPTEAWLAEVEAIKPRVLQTPDARTQEAEIEQILSELEQEPAEPSPQTVEETERALEELKSRIPDAGSFQSWQFVAGSFQSFLPAWKKLLAHSKRASSKKVLRWLEHGFVPKFQGTSEAEPKKKEAVKSMLRRVMTTEQINQFLDAKQPGPVEFKNQKSFYVHWDFSSKEVANLFQVKAAMLLPLGAPKLVIVHPFGVASTAGKLRLICDARALNIFLKNFPFRYEKLRDVLAYT